MVSATVDGGDAVGTVVVNPDGTITFTPAPEFVGDAVVQCQAPILLTDTQTLSAPTAAAIQELGATSALILGGTVAVSDQVAADLAALDSRSSGWPGPTGSTPPG